MPRRRKQRRRRRNPDETPPPGDPYWYTPTRDNARIEGASRGWAAWEIIEQIDDMLTDGQSVESLIREWGFEDAVVQMAKVMRDYVRKHRR